MTFQLVTSKALAKRKRGAAGGMKAGSLGLEFVTYPQKKWTNKHSYACLCSLSVFPRKPEMQHRCTSWLWIGSDL